MSQEIPALLQPRVCDATRANLREALSLVMAAQDLLRAAAKTGELHPRYTHGVNAMLNLVRWDVLQLIDQRRTSRGDEPRWGE